MRNQNPSCKGDWITNNPKTIKNYWPRRKALLKEGPPKATQKYTQEELIKQNIIGIYLDEDIPEGITSRPIITKLS